MGPVLAKSSSHFFNWLVAWSKILKVIPKNRFFGQALLFFCSEVADAQLQKELGCANASAEALEDLERVKAALMQRLCEVQILNRIFQQKIYFLPFWIEKCSVFLL